MYLGARTLHIRTVTPIFLLCFSTMLNISILPPCGIYGVCVETAFQHCLRLFSLLRHCLHFIFTSWGLFGSLDWMIAEFLIQGMLCIMRMLSCVCRLSSVQNFSRRPACSLSPATMLPIVHHEFYSLPRLPDGHRFPMEVFQRIHDCAGDGIISPHQVIKPSSFPLMADLTRVHSNEYVSEFLEGRLNQKAVRRIGFGPLINSNDFESAHIERSGRHYADMSARS